MNGGSLSNLVESVGSLPENILIEIARSIAETINFMHNKAKISHNGLSMSQIMFDRDGNMKLARESHTTQIQPDLVRILKEQNSSSNKKDTNIMCI